MHKIITFNILFLFSFFVQAESSGNKNGFKSEKAMFKQAERYFVKKDYTHAMPLYAQLISSHNDNYRLNYCYGICLLILDKDKSLAVKYLEAASGSIQVWDDVWYYLGRAYQLNGAYSKSISAYDQFVKMVSSKQVLRWEALHQIEMCKNAIILAKNPGAVTMLDSKNVPADQFWESYIFQHDERKLLLLPIEFATPKDKSNPNCLHTFLSADGKKMVFTSYGNEKSTNTDIFISEKNDRGIWEKPLRLGAAVNTKYDEAFPALSEDGLTMFFSSKGYNSMGGFDVFKTVYDPETRQWSKPRNMGIPVNSADDDFYYVPSETENIAYFSSKREAAAGEIRVYKIKLYEDRYAGLIINGEVINEYAAQIRKARIKVTRQQGGEVMAELISDEANGKFRYTLPGPGNYRISVRVEGFGPMAQSISFSENAGGRVKQIIYVNKDSAGYDYLRVESSFEENGLLLKGDYLTGNEISVSDTTAESDPVNITKLNVKPEPVTYNASIMPSVKEPDKQNLNTYFNEVHKLENNITPSGLVNLADKNEHGTNYKVQIGTFMHQSAEVVYGKLKEMGFDDLSYYSNNKGWIVFYTGHEKNISNTLKLKEMVINYGFKDAFIKVFENGKPSKPHHE